MVGMWKWKRMFLSGCEYTEVLPQTQELTVITRILRYKKDGEGEVESGCRLRLYKSSSGQRVRFVICDYEKDPNRHTSFQGKQGMTDFMTDI